MNKHYAIIGIFYSHSVFAGGLFLYEFATPDAALSAAGLVARAQDASTAQSNPAGMTRLKGNHLMMGSQLMTSNFGFDSGPQTTTQGNNGGNAVGILPGLSAFYTHSLTQDLRCGLALYGNFGSVLKYDDQWVGRYRVQKTHLLGLTMMPSLGYRLSPRWSVGGGLNLMYTFFGIKTAINTPEGVGDGELNIQNNQLGASGQLSFLFEPNHCTRFGLVYNSSMKLNFHDVPQFSNLGVLSPILKSSGLLDADLGLSMTVPQSVMVSVFHDLNACWALLSSVGWQNWSQFGRVGVELDAITSTSVIINHNYKDTWHSSLGFQYKTPYKWRLSSGIAYDSSMVDEQYRTPDTPISKTWRFGAGAQYPLSCGSSLNFAYTLDWVGDMPLYNQGGTLTGNLQGVYRHTALHFFGVSYQKIL